MGYLGRKIKNAQGQMAEGTATAWSASQAKKSVKGCSVCGKNYDKMSAKVLNDHYQFAKKGKKGCPDMG